MPILIDTENYQLEVRKNGRKWYWCRDKGNYEYRYIDKANGNKTVWYAENIDMVFETFSEYRDQFDRWCRRFIRCDHRV